MEQKYFKPLKIKKNYVFYEYYDRNTGEYMDIKNIKKVKVVYHDGEVKTYKLHYDTEVYHDMGCSSDIIKAYIYETFKGVGVKIYLNNILSVDGNSVFLVDVNPPKEDIAKPTLNEEMKELLATREELIGLINSEEVKSNPIEQFELNQRLIQLDFQIAFNKYKKGIFKEWNCEI